MTRAADTLSEPGRAPFARLSERAGSALGCAGAVAGAVAVVVATGAGCESSSTAYDPFPIPVAIDGAVLARCGLGDPADGPGELFDVVVDTNSPLTVIDSAEPGQPLARPSRERLTITLHATGADDVPRVRYSNASVFDLHPCADTADTALCQIGMAGLTHTIRGVIGADLLARTAVRVDTSARTLQLFPDIAGGAAARAATCDAVFDGPFHGGGTLLVGGAEISYTARRIALGTCLFDDVAEAPTGPLHPDTGVDLLLVLSTGIETTVLSESAYLRYRLALGDPEALPFEDLPATQLFLPSGPIDVRVSSVDELALVGQLDDERGPCAERFSNYFFYRGGRCNVARDPATDGPCPCRDSGVFCRSAAVLEIGADSTDTVRLPIAVVSEDEPLLHALRNELRPALPEVDGILGVSALADAIVDIDYPNGRVLARCSGPACTVRPELISESLIRESVHCLSREAGQPQ